MTRCPLVLRRGCAGLWRLIAPLSFAVASAPVLLARIAARRPDVVVCVEPTLFAAPLALILAWIVGAGTVLHVQDLEIDAAFATGRLRGAGLRWLAARAETLLLRRFDRVVTISDAMAARLARKGVPRDRLAVIRNWLAPIDRDACGDAYRAELGIGAEEPVLLYAGSLGAKQGIGVLIEALRRMPRPPRVVVAGEGPMRAAVADAGLPGLILLPLQPAERMADLLAMADIHVLPQCAEAADLVFPSKLGPMLASGRPVVVTARPGTELADWLGTAAVLAEPDAPDALAGALQAVLTGERRPDRAHALHLARTLDAGAILPAFERLLLDCRRGSAAAVATEGQPEPASAV